MTTQRTQHKKQKPHRGSVSAHVWQVHRLALQTIVIKMGFCRVHTQDQHRLINSNEIKTNHTRRLLLLWHGPVCILQHNLIRVERTWSQNNG